MDYSNTIDGRTANDNSNLCRLGLLRPALPGHATCTENITLRLSCTTAHILEVSDTHTNTRLYWATEGAKSQTASFGGSSWGATVVEEWCWGSPNRKLPQCIDSVRLCSLGELRLMFDKLAMRDLTLWA